MKKLATILVAALTLSASEVKDQLEYSFMVGCVQESELFTIKQSVAYCVCQWQGLEKKYSDKQLLAIDNSPMDAPIVKEMLSTIDRRVKECMEVSLQYK